MHTQSFNLYNSLVLLLCVLLYGSTNAQITIPSKLGGFWYNKESVGTNSIYIEAFLDPVCPDSRDAWPPLRKAIKHYGSPISLVVHTFPLPYHDNAYLCSRALHIVDNKLNASATYKLLEAFFQQQEKFYGKATSNFSRASVQGQVVKFATETVGISYASAIKLGFSDYKTDQAIRLAFKYGCLKGVYGTPFFFVNGFPLPDAGSAIDFKGWKRIIDPLIKQHDTKRQGSVHLLL